MVVDRYNIKTRSESRSYRVADKLMVNAGGNKVQKQATVKTGRTRKRRMGKPLVDLETYKTNWHRETGNTGINTLEKISNT